jgi:hypothetical protein
LETTASTHDAEKLEWSSSSFSQPSSSVCILQYTSILLFVLIFKIFFYSTSSSAGSNNKLSNRYFSPRVLNLPGGFGTGSSSWANAGNSIHAMFMAKRPSLQDQILESVRSSHLSVQRTKSAPLPNFFASLANSPPIFDTLVGTPSEILLGLNFHDTGGNDNNINSGGSGQQSSAYSRLESLCLSMTEAALS